ncbi:hypothetical protein DMP17_22005 [Pseudonocardia sp. TMWB2A]
MGPERISELSGVPVDTIRTLIYGKPSQALVPSQRVRPATADRLLAVRPDPALLAGGAVIDGTGTARRLQALVAMGHTVPSIAARLGMLRAQVTALLRASKVTASMARRVSDVYDALSMSAPVTDTLSRKQMAGRARATAARHGWVPPLAWDDDTIDDPAAVPDLGVAPQSAVDLGEDEHLRLSGVPDEQIAARMGVTRDALVLARRRARRREAS